MSDDEQEQFKPAWGGAQPGGGVAVPAEFEAVTDLGPAEDVIEQEGFQLLPHFGTPVPRVLVRYRDGFAYRTKRKDIHIWRWDEVTVIQSNVWIRSASEHGNRHAVHEYTLTSQSGEQLILNDTLKHVGGIGYIQNAVFALLQPPLGKRYRAGEALTFGPITIHQKNGLELDGTSHAWDGIRNIEVEYGRFKITLKDDKHREVRASKIPNIELLCGLIGLNLNSAKLAYT